MDFSISKIESSTFSGRITRDTIDSALRPRSDLSYQVLDDLVIDGVDLYQSLLTGSLIRNCQWTKVKFSRSDLDGVRIEKCTFTECDFTACDVRSNHIVQARFVSCILAEIFLSDCVFEDCVFIDCSFEGASFTSSRLYRSTMQSCIFRRGTYLHNVFSHCSIMDMLLGDCTFLYTIFQDCQLSNVTINADAIGSILGLTPDQIHVSLVVFLGKAESVPEHANVFELLLEEYSRRKWYIGQLILELNSRLLPPLKAIETYLLAIHPRIIAMKFAKGDELQFFGDVLEELARQERLPLLSAMDVVKWISDIQQIISGTDEGIRVDTALAALLGRMNVLCIKLIEVLESRIPQFDSLAPEIPVDLRITFKSKPALGLDALLNLLEPSTGLPYSSPAQFIRSERGSYVEIVSTTIFGVVALQVFLFLINGCVIQLTELKFRLKVLVHNEAPKSYKDLVMKPQQYASPMIMGVLRGLSHFAHTHELLSQASMAGYSEQNIDRIQISDHNQA